jgi:hypothetical protein
MLIEALALEAITRREKSIANQGIARPIALDAQHLTFTQCS